MFSAVPPITDVRGGRAGRLHGSWGNVFHSITAHSANKRCRRQIEKSPLAQIEMSLSTVSVGEHWADDGDYDEPDGDRPDERVAGSGGSQDQDRRGIDVDGTWPASGVSAGEGVRQPWPTGVGVTTAWQAKQPLLSDGFACRSDWHHPGALPGLWPNAGGGEARGAARYSSCARDTPAMDDDGWPVEGSPRPVEACSPAAVSPRLRGRVDPDRRIGALVVRGPRAAMHPARLH